MTNHPLAVTIPLEELESVVRTARRLGLQYIKAPDLEALELVEREIEAVKAAAEPDELLAYVEDGDHRPYVYLKRNGWMTSGPGGEFVPYEDAPTTASDS